MPITLPQGRLTQALLWVIALVYVALWALGKADAAAYLGGFIPGRISGFVNLTGAVPVWLTPLSATLLHGGVAHLGFNLLMLAFCGRFVESVVGAGPFAFLYIVGAYASAGAQYFAGPFAPEPMIGASGAISAVLGAYALLFSRQQVRAIGPLSSATVRVLWLAAAWILIQALFALATAGSQMHIAVAAHIGGFIAGLLLARPLLLWRYRSA